MADAIFAANTLGAMASRVRRWAREQIDLDTCYDAINDAREALWNAAVLASISKFIKSPVTLTIPANTTEFTMVSIPDPLIYAQAGQMAGGNLPARNVSVSFTYVTDSGSETRESLALNVEMDPAALLMVQPPPFIDEAVGWNLYAGVAGRRVLQTVNPLPFNISFIESPLGVGAAPGGVLPPQSNDTGDNIVNLGRLDVLNTDGQTLTNWLQTSVTSTAFTQFQNSYPTTCTWQRYAYDIIGNNKIEIRPQTGIDFTATMFMVTKPRRLRFPNSRLGFNNVNEAQSFIFRQALSDVLQGVYEDEAAEGWQAKADKVKQSILLSIVNESWNQNQTVRAYQPNRQSGFSGIVS